MAEQIRRLITATNADGKSYFLFDDATPHVQEMTGMTGLVLHDIWEVDRSPADNSGDDDAAERPVRLEPPRGGAVFRIVEFPPDKVWRGQTDGVDSFRSIQAENAQAGDPDDPMRHQTATIDFIICMQGEIIAVLDEGERTLRAGDTMVQRGTLHSWRNETDEVAILAGVLMSAEPL